MEQARTVFPSNFYSRNERGSIHNRPANFNDSFCSRGEPLHDVVAILPMNLYPLTDSHKTENVVAGDWIAALSVIVHELIPLSLDKYPTKSAASSFDES